MDSREEDSLKKKKYEVGSIVVRQRAREIYSHVALYQENVKPFSAGVAWLELFRQYKKMSTNISG